MNGNGTRGTHRRSMSEVELRASDRDRERVVEELRMHAAEGRLTVEELEERVQRALDARTADELAALTRDLPDPVRPTTRTRRRRSAARPEVRTYLAVMALLVTVWALAGGGHFWPLWPAVGWGVFLLTPSGARGGCAPRRPRASSI